MKNKNNKGKMPKERLKITTKTASKTHKMFVVGCFVSTSQKATATKEVKTTDNYRHENNNTETLNNHEVTHTTAEKQQLTSDAGCCRFSAGSGVTYGLDLGPGAHNAS